MSTKCRSKTRSTVHRGSVPPCAGGPRVRERPQPGASAWIRTLSATWPLKVVTASNAASSDMSAASKPLSSSSPASVGETIWLAKVWSNFIAHSGSASWLPESLGRPASVLSHFIGKRHGDAREGGRCSGEPLLGFKSMASACLILGWIETVHMVRKGHARCAFGPQLSPAEQFEQLVV